MMAYSTVASIAFHAAHAMSPAMTAVNTSPPISRTPALNPATSITPQAMIATDPLMKVMDGRVARHG